MRHKKTADQRQKEADQREAERKYQVDSDALKEIRDRERSQFVGISLSSIPEYRLIPISNYERE
jgi:hypothetical protein